MEKQMTTKRRAEPPQVRLKILLAEDEPMVRQLFAKPLTRAGHTVFEAKDGEQAEAVWREHKPFDVIALDVRMPYKSGVEVARLLKEEGESLDRILLFSGYPGANDCEDLETVEFLAKPFSGDEWVDKIRKVAEKGREGSNR